MPTIAQVNFDTNGWELFQKSDSVIEWRNTIPDGLYLNIFNIPPDIEANLDDLVALRASYRSIMNAGGAGMVSLDIVELNGVPAIKQIVKIPIPKKEHGLIYLASYTLPFAEFSYVIKVQCQEWGTTGIREAVVGNEALASGRVKLDSNNRKIVGWNRESFSDMNLAETEEYDNQFPQHPLSRARRYLNEIKLNLVIDAEVASAPKFKILKGR